MPKPKKIKLNPYHIKAYATQNGMTMEIYGNTKLKKDYVAEFDFEGVFWLEHFHTQLSDIIAKKKQDIDAINSLYNKPKC